MDNRANLSGKRVVVLGDRQILVEAIKLTLSKLLKVEIVERTADALVHQQEVEDLDLIVLLASSPLSEPPPALACASRGRVSLLMISDRSFGAKEPRIYHLGFPFACDQLCDQVTEILNGNDTAHTGKAARPTIPAMAHTIAESGRHEETGQ